MTQRTRHCTLSGVPVHFEEPALTKIREADLFSHLDGQRRFHGVGFSLLQHTALCIHLGSALAQDERVSKDEEHQLLRYVACHDLHEAYVGDMVKGLKDLCPDYQRIETLWEKHVHEHFGLTWPLDDHTAKFVHEVDHQALCVEALLIENPAFGWMMEDRQKRGLTTSALKCASFVSARPETLWKMVLAALHGEGALPPTGRRLQWR